MNKILSAAFAILLLAGVVRAQDCAPLLCDTPLPAPVAGVCPPPPPVCEPEPVCAPAPVCPEPPKPEVCVVKEVPVKKVVNEVRTVPVKKKVYEEECYVVNETRTETVNELRTRVAYRKVPTEGARNVYSVGLRTVENCEGCAPRLTRKVAVKSVPCTVYVKEAYDETYYAPVRKNYTVPVTKTRKVAREVEEFKTVTVPVTVTVMETRVASR